jgi:hypothetical protein
MVFDHWLALVCYCLAVALLPAVLLLPPLLLLLVLQVLPALGCRVVMLLWLLLAVHLHQHHPAVCHRPQHACREQVMVRD